MSYDEDKPFRNHFDYDYMDKNTDYWREYEQPLRRGTQRLLWLPLSDIFYSISSDLKVSVKQSYL